jgi:hypothetical protein
MAMHRSCGANRRIDGKETDCLLIDGMNRNSVPSQTDSAAVHSWTGERFTMAKVGKLKAEHTRLKSHSAVQLRSCSICDTDGLRRNAAELCQHHRYRESQMYDRSVVR